jgi:hypothetical protein
MQGQIRRPPPSFDKKKKYIFFYMFIILIQKKHLLYVRIRQFPRASPLDPQQGFALDPLGASKQPPESPCLLLRPPSFRNS